MPTLAELQASAAALAADSQALDAQNAAALAADSQALVAQNAAAAADSQSLAAISAIEIAQIKSYFAEVVTQKTFDTKDKAALAIGSNITISSTPTERNLVVTHANDQYEFVLMIRTLVLKIKEIKDIAVSRDASNTAVSEADKNKVTDLYNDLTTKLNNFKGSTVNAPYISGTYFSTVVSFLGEILEKLSYIKTAAEAAVTTNNEGNRKMFKEFSQEAFTRVLVIDEDSQYDSQSVTVPVTLFDKINVTKIAADLAVNSSTTNTNVNTRTSDTSTKASAAYDAAKAKSTPLIGAITDATTNSINKAYTAKIANKKASVLASISNTAAASAAAALSSKITSASAFGTSLPAILQPKICGIDLTKQALLNAIADKKKRLTDGLKNKAQAQIDMANAKLSTSADSLINKLLSNIPGLPENYKADIAKLLKKIIGPPPLNSNQIASEVAALGAKWGTTVTNGLAALVQDFVNGVTQDLCSIVAVKNYEKIGNNLPVVKPLESFIPTAVPEPVAELVSTVEDKSAVPNPDRVADTVVPKTIKDNYNTIIEKPIRDTILNVITSFYSYLPYTGSLQNSLLNSDIDDFFGNKKTVGGITWKMIMKRIKTLNLPTAADLYKSGKASDAEKQFLTELFLASKTRQVAQSVWVTLRATQIILEKKTAGAITPEEYSKTYSELIDERSKYLKEYNTSGLIKVDFTVTNDDFFKISYKTSSTQFSIKETVTKMETIYSANAQLIKDYYAVKDNK